MGIFNKLFSKTVATATVENKYVWRNHSITNYAAINGRMTEIQPGMDVTPFILHSCCSIRDNATATFEEARKFAHYEGICYAITRNNIVIATVWMKTVVKGKDQLQQILTDEYYSK